MSAYCPDCRALLVDDLSEAPWCPGCRWNLAAFEPGTVPKPGPLARLARRIAYRDTIATFERLREAGGVPSVSRGRHLLAAISVVLLAATTALAGLGVWLCVREFPSWSAVPGLICLAVAWYMRPRAGRLDEHPHIVDATDAPALHALIERVAAAAGTPRPHLVVVDADYNGSSGIVGLLRRRRVLTIGTPMWIGLGPQERVALLAHELAHFAGGDPRRMLSAQPALTVFAALADLTYPQLPPDEYPTLTDRIVYLLLAPVHKLMMLAYIGVLAIAMRDSQRAEYRADAIAARIAGRDAEVALNEMLVHQTSLVTITTSKARAREFTPGSVRTAVREAMARLAPRSEHHRQYSIRTELSLFSSHPPAGLRARLAEARPHGAAEVTCSEAESARIDGELAGLYEKTRLDVAHLD